MYSDIVLGVPHEDFEELLETEKLTNGMIVDADLKTENMRSLVNKYKELVKILPSMSFLKIPNLNYGELFRSI